MNNQSLSGYKMINEITVFIEKEMETNNIPGLSFALVDNEGVIWSEGFGHTDLSNKEEVTANTLFSTQSMGKCYTATAFLILATKGLISLDDPIRKYYPDFSINTKFGDPDEEIAKITFRRMLSHWASFTHEAPLGNNFDATPCTFFDHIQSINNIWLKSPVGSEHAYSNIGLDLTGYVMGLILNKSFEEVMNEVLFSPLGIVSASFNISKALKSSFAHGHSGLYATPDEQIPMLPAGGLYISANELAKFVSFHLRKGKLNEEPIIDPSLLEEMYKTQFHESKEYGYGLGIYSSEHIKGAKSFEHGGGGYGYQTLMKWVPEHNIGVIVLTNDMKHSSVGKIAKKALELFIEEKTLPESKPVEKELLRRLEGTYKAYRNPLFNVVYENSQLVIYPTTYSKIELIPQDATNFVTKGGKTCKFNLDSEGHPLSFYYDHPLFAIVAKYNDGARDKQGPNKEEWNDAVGLYTIQSYGREYHLAISIIDGHLYLIDEDCFKLRHHKDNIYFTADGESVLLEKDKLLFRNITAQKINLDLDKIITSIKTGKMKYDCYRGLVSSLVNILYVIENFETTLYLIDQVVGVDKDFKEFYSMLGKRTYALGKLDESTKCFTKLLDIDDENENAKDMIRKIKLRQI